ncbi:MAG: hypothetical protein ABSD58_01195 [Verrucomicrobiia bacterium]|jgi:hypothetical protein
MKMDTQRSTSETGDGRGAGLPAISGFGNSGTAAERRGYKGSSYDGQAVDGTFRANGKAATSRRTPNRAVGGGLQNEPNFVQAGVDISKKQSQKRTHFRGVVDWQNGHSDGKTKPN